jgi:hypothetical protein
MPPARAGEVQQRDHRQRKLDAEDHLAEREQIVDALIAAIPMTRSAGTIANERVIIRRTHGRMRQCMNPSITTCPASVPVTVELCPLASSATANSIARRRVPSSGASV